MPTAAADPVKLDHAAPEATPDAYRIGTLVYTRRSLITLFLWILWGDFAITTMAFITPSILPLMLKDLGATNQSMALICVTVPNALSLLIQPIISVKSDRLRTRWGRRIPLLMLGTPFLTVCILLLGFSAPISRWVYGLLDGRVSLGAIALATVAVLVVFMQFFNLMVSTAYYCLINDVVPSAFLSRFFALFNIVNRVANFTFLWFILGNALSHTAAIFIAIAVLYFVSFMLLALRVKEGEYPQPPPLPPSRVAVVKEYFTDTFGRFYYVAFFLALTFYSVGSVIGIFQIFFAASVGLSNAEYGKLGVWSGIPVLLLMYPAGILASRIHPIRAVLLSLVGFSVLHLFSLFFVRGFTSYAVMAFSSVFMTALMNVTLGPLQMLIYPRDRYAQFASAAALLTAGATIVFSYFAGVFIDWIGNYRFVYVWCVVFEVLATIFLYIVYRHWRIHGDTRDEVRPVESRFTVVPVSE